jgi:hypothetical protein
MEYRTTQVFNRRSIGFLWDKRAELDPGQVSIINSIYLNKKKGGLQGSQQILYKLSRSAAGRLGYGRLYGSKGSFETLEKECRGTICADFYHDIDIVNCHPVLLVQFAHQRYPDYPLLEVQRYNQDREAFLAEVMKENQVDRDMAKQAVISVLYGGLVSKDSVLWPLSQDVRTFSKMVFNNDPEFKSLAAAVKNEKNIYGSFLSYILQTEERRCMLALKKHLEDKGWSVDVLCYDGVMIRKREGLACDKQLLADCSAAIKDVTGFCVSLTSKEFSSFELPSLKEEVAKGVSLEAYQVMKEKFEMSHFYHPPSNKYVEVGDEGSLLFMEKEHAQTHLGSAWRFRHSDKFGDVTEFFPIWNADKESRRSCYETTFKDTDDPKMFQMPINFAYMKASFEYAQTEVIPTFLEIVRLITSGDPILSEYVLNWTAHLLQQPTDLPGVALVLTGSKGIGKDTFGDFLQEFVVGRYLSTNYTTNKQFFGTHDTGKLNKFLIKLEETSKKDCFENASELKSSITAVQVTANPKGVKEITADNFARFIFTTNKANPVDMSDQERRFVLLKCSAERKGDHEFWKKVRSVLFNPSAGAEVAHYLLQRDISQFQIRKLPENQYQHSIVKSEESSEQKFIAQWDGEKVTADTLYDLYKDYCLAKSLPYANNAVWFGRNLQPLVRDNTIINSHPCNVSHYEKPKAD